MAKKYIVELDPEEREQLRNLVRRGKQSARRINRARILLLADDGRTDEEIWTALQVGKCTVERTRQRFVEEGLEAALNERPRPGKPPKLDGKQEALLVAIACSEAPDGRDRWTMQLLADRLVELKVVDSIVDETVRRVLKKTTSNRGKRRSGASRK
jgi:transposase